MKITKETAKNIGIELIYDIVGAISYGAGLLMFVQPNQIAMTGAAGVAVLINYVTGFPIGIGSFLVNVPLLILAFLFLGRQFTVKTLITTAIFSFMVDIIKPFVPTYTKDPILACLFGAVLIGFGVVLIYMRRSTSGGTDIVCRLVQLRFPYMSMGKPTAIVNSVIIISAMILYRSLESGLYALVVVVAQSFVIDAILYGADKGKLVYIISDHAKDISKAIISEVNRGCTLLNATGAFTEQQRQVAMCVVRTQQFFKLKEIIMKIDPKAFIIVTDSNDIIGQGFKAIDKTR